MQSGAQLLDLTRGGNSKRRRAPRRFRKQRDHRAVRSLRGESVDDTRPQVLIDAEVSGSRCEGSGTACEAWGSLKAVEEPKRGRNPTVRTESAPSPLQRNASLTNSSINCSFSTRTLGPAYLRQPHQLHPFLRRAPKSSPSVLFQYRRQVPPLQLPKDPHHRSRSMPPEVAHDHERARRRVDDDVERLQDNLLRDRVVAAIRAVSYVV